MTQDNYYNQEFYQKSMQVLSTCDAIDKLEKLGEDITEAKEILQKEYDNTILLAKEEEIDEAQIDEFKEKYNKTIKGKIR